MIEVRLLIAHRVNKVLRQPGELLTLPEQTAEWFVAQGMAERADTPLPRAVRVPKVAAQSALKFVPGQPKWSCCGRRK